MDELITRSNISPADYKTLYPLFVFDVSKQSEKLKSSVVDVQIRAIKFRVPLKHIFGFCEDYDKIVYGLKHTLTLVRKLVRQPTYQAVPAGTQAYAVVMSDKLLTFQSDGSKMSVVY